MGEEARLGTAAARVDRARRCRAALTARQAVVEATSSASGARRRRREAASELMEQQALALALTDRDELSIEQVEHKHATSYKRTLASGHRTTLYLLRAAKRRNEGQSPRERERVEGGADARVVDAQRLRGVVVVAVYRRGARRRAGEEGEGAGRGKGEESVPAPTKAGAKGRERRRTWHSSWGQTSARWAAGRSTPSPASRQSGRRPPPC